MKYLKKILVNKKFSYNINKNDDFLINMKIDDKSLKNLRKCKSLPIFKIQYSNVVRNETISLFF